MKSKEQGRLPYGNVSKAMLAIKISSGLHPDNGDWEHFVKTP
jgi:hypothetical protein